MEHIVEYTICWTIAIPTVNNNIIPPWTSIQKFHNTIQSVLIQLLIQSNY